MMLQRAGAEQRVRPQDPPALVGGGPLPALLHGPAGLPERLEEKGLLVGRSVLPARLEGSLNCAPGDGRLLWLGLLRLGRRGGLLRLGLLGAGPLRSARGLRFGRLGRVRRCRRGGAPGGGGAGGALLGGLLPGRALR